MRQGRCRAEPDSEVAYYHCISRIVDRRFIFGVEEKEEFVALMRGYEAFCGVRVVTFCSMGNHFHILVSVPHRPPPELLPTDQELVSLLKKARYSYNSVTLAKDLERFRLSGQTAAAEALRERFFVRMWDLSWFMKLLKQRFSQWYNGRNCRVGTLWEDRFKSVLVEGKGRALSLIATYIDLNPVRAKIVSDPKDYRWCGYAQAVAGIKTARDGLRVAVEAILDGEPVSQTKIMAQYRRYLFERGEGWSEDDDCGQPGRRGMSQEQVEAVIAAGGRLELADALRCRVRYFCDSAVFGGRAFVDAFFKANRRRFGVKRKDGARRLRNLNAPDLFSLRDLRVRLIG